MEDWTLSYGPITIGDAETLPAVNFTVFDPLSMPDVRTNDVTLIQRDGLWAGDDYMGGRTIPLSLQVQGSTRDEFSEAVNLIYRAFSPGVSGEIPLRFKIPGLCQGREAYINARTRRRSNPLDANFARLSCAFEIELFATDPYVYAADESSVTLRKGVPALMHVDGSWVAKPTITFTDVTDPKITNVETGGALFFNGSGTWSVDAPNYAPGGRYLVLSDLGSAEGTAVYKWRDRWV
ncbi:hypothetical protein ACIRP5_09930 [Streptomyces sp. NPDC101221]|uniref:hypothetical protein n=1 Tax=Streptomyces sp. NPDC101221 TaxID=3366132 RepID=UPI00382AB8A6